MKTSTNKILTIAVVFLLLANIALVIFMMRGNDRKDSRKNRQEPHEVMAKELGMTEEQKTGYKKLREEHFAAIRPLFDSMGAIKKSFFGLVKDESANDSVINNYSNRIAAVQSAIDKLTLAHFKKVRSMFSGEQLTKYDEFVQKMTHRMSGRWRKDSAAKKE